MTSSLVGSEMCIRDRMKTSLLPGLGAWSLYSASVRTTSLRRRRADGAPVSYTHLTLPTICSV
eukprot:380384-Prorocentrum_lima.AAC.1